jgi:hypothetical protein
MPRLFGKLGTHLQEFKINTIAAALMPIGKRLDVLVA